MALLKNFERQSSSWYSLRQMTRIIRLRILAILCPAITTLLSAQTACPTQTVVVNVRASNGSFVENLPPVAFRAASHGNTLTISAAKSVFGAHRVVLVVDASGSMSTESRFWQNTKSMAEQLVEESPDSTRLALIAFASRPIITLNFGHSKNEIRSAIKQIAAGADARVSDKQTALWDTLLQAQRLFSGPEPGDSVIVISDGGDTHSRAKEQDVERTYLAGGIRLFAVVVQASAFITEEERSGAESLVQVARATGAETAGDTTSFNYDVKPSDPAFLNRILQELGDEVAHYYVLEISGLQLSDKGFRWKLGVVAGNGKKREALRVTYPRQLQPCVIARAAQ